MQLAVWFVECIVWQVTAVKLLDLDYLLTLCDFHCTQFGDQASDFWKIMASIIQGGDYRAHARLAVARECREWIFVQRSGQLTFVSVQVSRFWRYLS
jgi:hypothetical protein